MAEKKFVIMGATGHIGEVLVKQLLKLGHNVTALGRDWNKLSALESQGAQQETIEDFANTSALTGAFKDADAVFSFTPPGYSVDNIGSYQDKVGEAVKTAIQKNHIRYILNLSSIGAELPEGTGPIKGLYRQEQRLNLIADANVLHLRPGYFMENLLWLIPFLKKNRGSWISFEWRFAYFNDSSKGYWVKGCRAFRSPRF